MRNLVNLLLIKDTNNVMGNQNSNNLSFFYNGSTLNGTMLNSSVHLGVTRTGKKFLSRAILVHFM